MVNTIEHDLKSFQVKIIIVNCTEVQLKGFKISTAHRRNVGIADVCVTQL